MAILPKNKIKICTWNCRGINNKYHELIHFLQNYDIDVLLATVTKLAPHLHYRIPGYYIYRADHPSNERQGGSAIIIKTSIAHTELLHIIEPEFQISRIQLILQNNKLQVGSFYSAPKNKIKATDFWAIFHELQSCYLLGGDFNSKHPRWGSNVINPRGRILHDVSNQLNLELMYPCEPTHYPDDGSIPDLLDFFTGKNVIQICSNPSVLHELTSDHYPVLITLNDSSENFLTPTLIKHPFNWKIYTSTLNYITNTQISLKSPRDIDAAVATVTRNIQFAANAASSHTQKNNSRHIMCTFSPLIQQLHQEKKKCRKLWEQTKYPQHKTNYNRATKELKEALKKERSTAFENQLKILNPQDGSLWKKTKQILKTKEKVPPLKMNNQWFSTPQSKANLFSNQLYNQFQPNPITDGEFIKTVCKKINEPLQLSPFNLFFTPAQVQNSIKRSPQRKAPGPDLITKPLLEALPKKTLVFLTQIYNAMLRTTYFPAKWKHAIITMIPKPLKTKTDPKNYRPISLLSIFSKIFERLLLPHLISRFENTLPLTQFGFRPSHSCPQQLHRIVDTILKTYEDKEVCLGLFLDTEKAFDKIWHEGLLCKIKPHLCDTLYRITESYLRNRTFSVKCEFAQSTSKSINAGVPQGSVLGPLLYIIYTADFPASDQLIVAHFADDVAVLSKGTCETATNKLQDYCDQIDLWCKQWRVAMNPNKSNIVRFTYKNNIQNYPIQLKKEVIPLSQSVRYLGVTLDERLTWQTHISNIINKLRNRLSQLKFLLSRSSLSLRYKKLLYTSLIRPIWMYSGSIWGSASPSQIKRIQTFQNRCLRLITNAPWYIRNSTLHTDLQVPDVTTTLRQNYLNLQNTFVNHRNPLVQQILQNYPPHPINRRLKRKWHSDLRL